MKRRRSIDILFMMPTLLAFGLVVLVPFGLGIYYSLTDWNGVSSVIKLIGFRNYESMFREPQFIFSFLITLQYTVINVVFVNLVGFLLALMVTSQLKLRNFYRAGFFVPNLIGGLVLGYIWQFIFNNVVVDMGTSLGLPFLASTLTGKPDTVIWAMSFVNTWQYAGYIMMIYVAAIQSIPASLMEAANVDGAGFFRRVRSILIPMVANAFTITIFLTLTNSFKQYDLNFALTGGRPALRFMDKAIKSSQLLAMDIYQTAMGNNKLNEAQAKAVVFFIVLVVASVIQVSINKRREVEA